MLFHTMVMSLVSWLIINRWCISAMLSALMHRSSAFASVKYLSQHPHPRAKTWHKIWMTGLNPNYDTIPIPSLQKSQNKGQKASFTYNRRRRFDSAVTASARPPNFEGMHLLLRSTDWWRHNILFSITRTIWILSECKLSTDNYVNY